MKMLRKLGASLLFSILCLCVFGGFTVPEDANENLVTVCCTDGRILKLTADAAKDYTQSNDWSEDFGQVTVTIWNTAGDTRVVLKGRLPNYLAQGWSDKLSDVTVLMKNTDGKEKEIFKDYVDSYKEKGWKTAAAVTQTSAENIVVKNSVPSIALTFDDGPNSATTSRLLSILEKYQAKATFFMLGNRAEKNYSCVKQMYELGMEIGNHSYDHAQLTKLSADAVKDEIEKTNQIIYQITGEYPTVLRPPYGSYDNAVKELSGMPLILWSLDTLDWKSKNADSVYSVVTSNVKDGSILLFHDIYESSVDAVERLIPKLLEDGYELVTVSELASRKGKSLAPGQVFSQG